MRPEEIVEKFGAQALDKLYYVLFDRSIHDLADWVLSYHSEEDIASWLKQLDRDEKSLNDEEGV